MSVSGQRALRWVVHGRVQGVSYRYFTRQAARELGLAGWTKNLPDGTVEVRVVGAADTLARFEQQLRQGPPLGRVDSIDQQELEVAATVAEVGSGFEIRY